MPIYFMVTVDFKIFLFLPQNVSGFLWSVKISVVCSYSEVSCATFLPFLTAIYYKLP